MRFLYWGTRNNKPPQWPSKIAWPLPRGVTIKIVVPMRYALMDANHDVTAVVSTTESLVGLSPTTIKMLPPIYILSNGQKVHGDLPFRYQQAEQTRSAFLQRWALTQPSAFQGLAYQSAFFTFSTTRLDKKHEYKTPRDKMSDKPLSDALWFAVGLAWYEFPFYADYRYVYQVLLKDSVVKVPAKDMIDRNLSNRTKTIVVLRDARDVKAFQQKYGRTLGEMMLYDWTRVAKDYCGILNYRPRDFDTWAIPSGCVWDTACVHDLVLVGVRK